MSISLKTIKRGFTLVELLVVIVIIGILATLTTVSLTSARGKARDARRISDLKQISTALELYQADNNSYPALITGGNSLASPDGSKVYMKKVPSDPSTNTSYAYGGSASRFTIRTNIEKAVESIPVGPVIITNNGSVRQATNVDNGYMNPDLTFGALVGHWALNGITGTSDLSGSDNHGSIVGDAATSTGRFVESLGAYSFNGSSDAVAFSSDNNLDLTSEITVSAWIKVNAVGGYQFIASRNYAAVGDYAIVIRSGSSQLRLYAGATNYNSQAVPLGTWTHVAMTAKNGLDGIRAYVNGDNVSKFTLAGSVTGSSSGNFSIGRVGTSYYFGGSIADVRIYDRALDANEIAMLYNATRP